MLALPPSGCVLRMELFKTDNLPPSGVGVGVSKDFDIATSTARLSPVRSRSAGGGEGGGAGGEGGGGGGGEAGGRGGILGNRHYQRTMGSPWWVAVNENGKKGEGP